MAELEQGLPEGVVTRRHFLYLTGTTAFVGGAGAILAACSSGAASPTPVGSSGACPSVTKVTTPVGGPFNLFTWAGYDGKGVGAMDAWYADQKIDLNVKYISNENLENYLKSSAGQVWDASSNNQGDCEHGYASGIQAPISVEEIPALGKMYDTFRNGTFWQICDGVYNSVPWTWSPLGINTRTDRVDKGALTHWDELLDPKYLGRIGTYDDALNMISVGAVATSNDPGALTRDQLNGAVKDWLAKLKPQLKVLSTSIGDQLNLLASGDVDIELVGLLWFVSQAQEQSLPIDFRVPDEGTYGFVDAVIITPWAKSRQNAVAYANALLEGDTAVEMQNSTFQMSTNPDVNAMVDPAVRSLYPDDLESYLTNTLKWNKSYFDANGQYATIDEWRKVWDDVKAGV
jgi:spermidine/putrescine-binding protein